MAQMGQAGLSRQEKQELWSRWKAGQSLSDIGRSLGKHAGSIFGVLFSREGRAPASRRRSSRSLSMFEREEISRGLVGGLDMRGARCLAWRVLCTAQAPAMTAQLVTDAQVMAVLGRGKPDALVHPSDCGSQYTSEQFQRLMAEHGVVCSMSRSDKCRTMRRWRASSRR